MSTEHNEPDWRSREGEIHPEEAHNPEVAYDRSDMDPKAIVGFLIALALGAIFMHLILWSVFKYYARPAQYPAPVAGPLRTSGRPKGNPEQTFPAPRLQSNDAGDMSRFRAHEEQLLNSYGWVDQNAGVARIPIDQAMQALVKQGLPTRPATPNNAAEESAQAPAPGSGGAVTKSQDPLKPKSGSNGPPNQ